MHIPFRRPPNPLQALIATWRRDLPAADLVRLGERLPSIHATTRRTSLAATDLATIQWIALDWLMREYLAAFLTRGDIERHATGSLSATTIFNEGTSDDALRETLRHLQHADTLAYSAANRATPCGLCTFSWRAKDAEALQQRAGDEAVRAVVDAPHTAASWWRRATPPEATVKARRSLMRQIAEYATRIPYWNLIGEFENDWGGGDTKRHAERVAESTPSAAV